MPCLYLYLLLLMLVKKLCLILVAIVDKDVGDVEPSDDEPQGMHILLNRHYHQSIVS